MFRRFALLLLVAAWGWAQEAPLGRLVVYNAGRTRQEGIAVGPRAGLGFAVPDTGIRVVDADGELPSQVSATSVAVRVRLEPYEQKILAVYPGEQQTYAELPGVLRHIDDQAAWQTHAAPPCQRLRIDKTKHTVTCVGAAGHEIADANGAWEVWVWPPDTSDREEDIWRRIAPQTPAAAKDWACEVLDAGPLFQQYRITWSGDLASVEKRVSVRAGEPLVRFAVTVTGKQRLAELSFGFSTRRSDFPIDYEQGVFLPDDERVHGTYDGYKHRFLGGAWRGAPGWVAATSAKGTTLGLCVPTSGPFDRLAYGMQHDHERSWYRTDSSGVRSTPALYLVTHSGNLLHDPVGTVYTGSAAALLPARAEEVEYAWLLATSPLRLRGATPADRGGRVSLPATPLVLGEQYRGRLPSGGEYRLDARPVGTHSIDFGGTDLIVDIRSPVSIERLLPDKLLYAANEDASCRLRLRNWQPQPCEVTVLLRFHRDLDTVEEFTVGTVGMEADQTVDAALRWNTGSRRYGVGIEAVIVAADGTVLDRRSDAVNVADDWLPLAQYGTRGFYCNFIHFHNVQAADGSLDVPMGDYQHRGHEQYHSNGQALLDAVRDWQCWGGKACFYLYIACTPWASEDFGRNPRRVLYDASGQPATRDGDMLQPDIFAPGFRDWLVGQIDASTATFGWDAAFLDVSQAPSEIAADLHDWQGRPAGRDLGDDPDTIAAAFHKDLVDRIQAKYPAFQFFHNPEVFKSEFRAPKSFAAAGRTAMLEMGGGGGAIANKGNKYGTWVSMLDRMNAQRYTKLRYGVDHIRTYPLTMGILGGDNCSRGVIAFTFACGFNNALGGDLSAGAVASDWPIRYMRFGATRYSALIYGDDVQWVPGPDVKARIEAPTGVYWKDFVYRRPHAAGEDTIVHLVQAPPGKYVWRQLDRPEVVRDLEAHVPAPAGMALRDVWLLSPDRQPEAVTLRGTVTDDVLRVLVPALEVWDMLVVRWQKGGE